jgi:hypothetical protein
MKTSYLLVIVALVGLLSAGVCGAGQQPTPSWSQSNPGVIRLAKTLASESSEGHITKQEETQTYTLALKADADQLVILARQYRHDHDLQALRDGLAKITVGTLGYHPKPGTQELTNDQAKCQAKAGGFYWGCFDTGGSSCNTATDAYYRRCLAGENIENSGSR